MKKTTNLTTIKKQGDKKSSFLAVLMRLSCYASIFFLVEGCYEPIEGCLDNKATNFQVDADAACSNCCNYPVLKLLVEHKVVYPDATYNFAYNDSIYQDGAGNAFRVKNIQFFLSDFRLIKKDGTELAVRDSLEVEIFQPDGTLQKQFIRDDAALVNRNTFSTYEIGTLVTKGEIRALRFSVGLVAPANSANPASFPTGHPLRNTVMYFNSDSGYVFNQLQLFNSATLSDTTTTLLEIGTTAFARTVEVPLSANVLEGFNIRITLRVNYLQWFQDVNLKTDAPASLATKIVNNAANSFSVVGVVLEGL